MLPNGFSNIAQDALLTDRTDLTYEVEIRFKSYDNSNKGRLSLDVFDTFGNFMQQNYRYQRSIYTDYIQNIRNSLTAPQYSTLRVQVVQPENKDPYLLRQVKTSLYREYSQAYPLLFNVSQEQPIATNDIRYKQFKVQDIRIKDRKTFHFHDFRIDITKVKEYKPVKGAFAFKEDYIYQGLNMELEESFNTYEIELEISTLQGLENIQTWLVGYMKILWQTNLLYTSYEYGLIVNYYNKVLGSDINKQNHIDYKPRLTRDQPLTFNSKYLYKPRNLKMQDLVYGGIVGNRHNNYIVSYKADGERRLLIIDQTGIWLIAPLSKANLIVRLTEQDNTFLLIKGSILEGELIALTNHKGQLPHNPKYIFYCYDMLAKPSSPGAGTYLVSTNIQGKDYVSRWEACQEVANLIQAYNDTLVNRYNTRPLPLWVGTKKIMQLSLYDVYPDPSKFFLVMEEILLAKDTVPYKQDGLIFTPSDMPYYQRVDQKYALKDRILTKHPDICKWKPVSEMTIDLMVLNSNLYVGNKSKSNIEQSLYYQDRYYLEFVGSNNFPFSGQVDWPSLEQYKDVDASVIEFIINREDNSLIAYRVRKDKPYPNDIIFALDTWNWAHNPITESTLMGKDTVLMRKYHNRIKRQLYLDNKGKTLLDIGSGRGGDVSKWKQAGFEKILAVEPDGSHIQELQRRIDAAEMTDKVRIIRTGGQDTSIITTEVNNFLGGPADVVSMMLSMSFFWSDTENLKGLLQTIVNNIKPDGKFIYMTIDGVSVSEYFKPQLKKGTNIYNLDTEIYELRLEYPTGEDKKQNRSQIYINIKDSVTALDQKEWLVYLDDVSLGLYAILYEAKYFSRADKEKLLNPSELLLTRLYTYGVYSKIKEDIVSNQPYYDIKKEEILPGISVKKVPEPPYLPKSKTLTTVSAITPTCKISPESPLPTSLAKSTPLTTGLERLHISTITTPAKILAAIPENSVVEVVNNWYNNVVRIGCIADGSCFVHALLTAVNQNYAQNIIDRRQMAAAFRRDVAYLLSQKYPPGSDIILYAQYPQFLQYYIFTKEEMYTLPGLMRLINSTQYLGEEVYIIFADLLDINLYITVAKTDRLQYLNQYTKPNREWNIVISGNTQHYELIGIKENNLIQTAFRNDDPFILALNKKPA